MDENLKQQSNSKMFLNFGTSYAQNEISIILYQIFLHAKRRCDKCTYIPAFLAALTPDGASSNTRILCGSTEPPCGTTNCHEL